MYAGTREWEQDRKHTVSPAQDLTCNLPDAHGFSEQAVREHQLQSKEKVRYLGHFMNRGKRTYTYIKKFWGQ